MAKKKSSVNAQRATGWLTTDEQEYTLRRRRAADENIKISPISLTKGTKTGIYQASKVDDDGHEKIYDIEFRSASSHTNTCSCADFRKNFLGTCKHIEKVKSFLAGKTGVMESPLIEVFVRYVDGNPMPFVQLPDVLSKGLQSLFRKYTDGTGSFRSPQESVVRAFMRNLETLEEDQRGDIRISVEFKQYAEELKFKQLNNSRMKDFEWNFDNESYLKHPLYDYQLEGMKHLAFTGRAMLCDEMGLGKTVQAIAAAKVLKDIYKIRQVLIVCPASLKTEWEEQIEKFTSLTSKCVFGSRKERLKAYSTAQEFFLITNYEQILRDFEDINKLFSPDLIIIDEAQRIKNWKTKTARAIKELDSPFAFLLTGTPLENRIDEVYSLTEFVNERLLGSLFRFNREFYQFDEFGKTVGMKNLRELHEMLKPVMLRRRKSQIEEQLPDRIDNNYFVKMTDEQQLRYADYEAIVARLAHAAKRRPLRPEEHERMQRSLGCMRMLCDSCYILDSEIRESPKVDELMKILNDIWSNDPDRKIIIFSEWVRMLELVQDRLEEQGEQYALHTGSVPQHKRRDEINRFKESVDCKLFLSSESGGVGLNLQAASVVINLDLPWNPAKLEQRIARAWRKHQKNCVNVINLVSEKTIEHRMLDTLSFKQGLSDAVLDNMGDTDTFEQQNARSAFMDRLGEVIDSDFVDSEEVANESAETPNILDLLTDEVKADHENHFDMCAIDHQDGNLKSVVAVSKDPGKAREKIDKAIGDGGKSQPDVTVLSREELMMLQSLAEKGLITLNFDQMEKVVEKEIVAPKKDDTLKKRLKLADQYLNEAARPLSMAKCLFGGGFEKESVAPAIQVLDQCIYAIHSLLAEEFEIAPESFSDGYWQKLSIPEGFCSDTISLLKTMNLGKDFTDNSDTLLTTVEKAVDEISSMRQAMAMRV